MTRSTVPFAAGRNTPHWLIAICLAFLITTFSGVDAGRAQGLARVQEITSGAGIKAWLIEDHSVSLISMRFGFKGGSVQDPAGKEGTTSLMADMFTEGAGELDSAAFKKRLDQLASKFSLSTSRDVLTGGLTTITRRFADSARLVRTALTHPRFEAKDLQRLKEQALTQLAFEEREAINVALKNFYSASFGSHPYGRAVSGDARSIAAITSSDLKAQHGRLLARSKLGVVFVGDIDAKTARRTLDLVFGALPAHPQLKKIDRVKPIVISKTVPWRGPRATAVFALKMPEQGTGDFFAALVLNQLLGSGNFDARLTREIRVERGLTYSIGSRILSDRYASLMLGTFSTRKKEMTKALKLVKDVLLKFAKEGPTKSEFANAKSALTGSYLLGLDTSSKLAGHLLGNLLDGHGPNYFGERARAIQALDISDIQKAARRFLREERFSYVIVGSQSQAESLR